MAVLLLHRPIAFPASRIRQMLTQMYPNIVWRAGEEDDGRSETQIPLIRPQTILGRDGPDIVIACVELVPRAYAPANGNVPPAHSSHITISRASTPDDAFARGIALIVATTLAVEGDEGALLQLDPGENWLDTTDMRSLAKLLETDRSLARRGDFGRPEQGGDAAPVPAPTDERVAPPGRLGSFTLLLDRPIHIDWSVIDEGMRAVDPGGGWTSCAVPQGMGFIQGRSKITLIALPMPYDPSAIHGALGRSFWFDGDRDRIARQRGYITISAEAPDSFEAKLATAKVLTLIVGVLARDPAVVAVFNNMVSTLFSPEMASAQMATLTTGQIPIQLWVWAAPNRIEDGNASFTTGGLEPFLGYEVEVWNAPYPVATVAEKLSGVLRYLLQAGPVIAHGDTIGTSADDQQTRCFFGPSRADRPQPVKAMFVEFGEPAAETPRPDPVPPPAPPPPPPAPPAFGRRPGGFGRKGL
ncbi:DUF4261 domain-containing protein [Sphingomonas sp. MMS12-HWE2-04]|uniref:DUF4261 domain-containing protein n=1 Tax=Sphingomonas sp. MMS12-HWE2-04 TaxID=3234199 RepID=UPI00384FEEC8